MKALKSYYLSPIGVLELIGNDKGLMSCCFVEEKESKIIHPCFDKVIKQLDEYFERKRTTFELTLILEGTDFRKSVWDQLQKIPFGVTVSYLDIAKSLNDPNATRAIGNANGKNP
ncbi:MAG: methylated-DNA--[protein]-cysteine S-methyltransferase, partial [Flavobacteriales bacterium]|nr:methylated-DNA--[protein]-cysteine S-methyltransferase [Flavobacteriales bacterium]